MYLFQKSPSGAINVLFPDPRITLQNPISPGNPLRIPQGGASFKLDEKDLGAERVYVVASLDPVAALGRAVEGLGSGGAPTGPVAALTQMGSSPECATRALNLEQDSPAPGCTRERGLSLDDDAPAGAHAGAPKASITARTEAADSVIARVFSFQHVQ